MYRNIIQTLAMAVSLLVLAACGTTSTPTNPLTILPKDCRMQIGERMLFRLDGSVPPNAVVTWSVDYGSIVSAAPGLNAHFTAPADPALVTITVSFSSGTPAVDIPIMRQCNVTSLDYPTAVPTPGSGMGPAASPFSQEIPTTAINTVIISEVMANPCGPVDVRKWNEYVELYNYGDQPVDVGGWWLADVGEVGTPDQLVSWSQRNPSLVPAANVVLNSTIIPGRSFAVVLSPIYTQGVYPYTMPYRFPNNTVILTIAESRSLGDDFFSIIGDGQSLDPLVLYKGGNTVIQEVISTYGTPKMDSYVSSIRDNNLDNLPLNLHECSSVERISPTGPDAFDNWREIINGSPGEAPY